MPGACVVEGHAGPHLVRYDDVLRHDGDGVLDLLSCPAMMAELRPAAGITESAAQSEQWNELRKSWMSLVVRRAEASEWPAAWRDDLPGDLGGDCAEIRTILSRTEPPIPAVYGSGTETSDYPVPADMRTLRTT